MSDHLAKLKDAIETLHRCKAVHVSSEVVVELFRGEVAWDGVVETFDLTGHREVKRCYAWSYEDKGETQYVTILEVPPVDSPETAVKVAIAAEEKQKKRVQTKPYDEEETCPELDFIHFRNDYESINL